LEAQRAARVERGGQRAAVVKAAAPVLADAAAGLGACRDAVEATAMVVLRALVEHEQAVDAYGKTLVTERSAIAQRGLRVRDDLVDEGQEHAEGVLDTGLGGLLGLRAGGVDWTPLPPGGVTAAVLRQVYGHLGQAFPLGAPLRHHWRRHEVETRPDGLKVPTLEDAGVTLPEQSPRPVPARRAEIEPGPRPPQPDRYGFITEQRRPVRTGAR
jgi:hypothetical protein